MNNWEIDKKKREHVNKFHCFDYFCYETVLNFLTIFYLLFKLLRVLFIFILFNCKLFIYELTVILLMSA
jgi:hypothetical protein